MPRDIAPLTRALDETTSGDQHDIYTLLAAWNRSIENAIDHGGWDRGRQVYNQFLDDVIDLVDSAAIDSLDGADDTHDSDAIDWAFLEECVDAYPAGIGDHYCSSVLANVVARCVIRTRIRDGVEAIPSWTLEYFADITIDTDGEWAWESAAAFGWGVGHPDVAVIDWTVDRAEGDDDSWAMNVLPHVTFADPAAGVDLLERLLESPDVVEDLLYLNCIEPPFEQDFPDFPEFWDPASELDYHVEITDDLQERLLAVIGSSIHPDRLRHFADSYRFDLERAAETYGTEATDSEQS